MPSRVSSNPYELRTFRAAFDWALQQIDNAVLIPAAVTGRVQRLARRKFHCEASCLIRVLPDLNSQAGTGNDYADTSDEVADISESIDHVFASRPPTRRGQHIETSIYTPHNLIPYADDAIACDAPLDNFASNERCGIHLNNL